MPHFTLQADNTDTDSLKICDHIESTLIKCERLYRNGEVESVLTLAKYALGSCDHITSEQAGKFYNLCGNIYEDQGNFKKAMDYYGKALSCYLQKKDMSGVSLSINNIGNIYYRWSRFDKALIYQKQALEIRKFARDKAGIASSFNNIGNIYYSWKKYSQALGQYKKALAIKKELNNPNEVVNILINLGSAYLAMGNFKEAEKNYDLAFETAQKQRNIVLQTDCQINIGYTRFLQSQYPEAISFYKSAFLSSKKNKLMLEELMSSKNLAEVYYAIDSVDIGNLYFNRAWTLAEQNSLKEVRLDLMTMKMEWKEKEGKIDEAYLLLKQSKSLSDSIFNETSMQQILDIQSLEKAEKQIRDLQVKNLEINLREEKIRFLRNSIVFIIIILITINIAFFINYKYQKKRSELNHEKKMRQSIQKALSAQMNPHFISNSLNSIQNFFLKNDVEAASSYLNDFGSLIRSVLNCSMNEFITIEEEARIIKLYTQLEALRLNKPIELIFESAADFEPDQYKIPPLLLQPIVENAIWHGIAHHQKPGKITVNFSVEQSYIRCSITDNGVGRVESSFLNSFKQYSGRKSYGLKLVQDRLKMMKTGMRDFTPIIVEDLYEGETTTGTKVIIYISII